MIGSDVMSYFTISYNLVVNTVIIELELELWFVLMKLINVYITIFRMSMIISLKNIKMEFIEILELLSSFFITSLILKRLISSCDSHNYISGKLNAKVNIRQGCWLFFFQFPSQLITILFGANDICSAQCYDPKQFSPMKYALHLRRALDYLKVTLPRTLVNLVPAIGKLTFN